MWCWFNYIASDGKDKTAKRRASMLIRCQYFGVGMVQVFIPTDRVRGQTVA